MRAGARRRSRARRSVREWLARISLCAVVLLVGYIAVSFSLAQALLKTDPQRAYALAPYDGRTAAALSDTNAGEQATPADRRRADDLALGALRRDPTAVRALSTLGMNSEVRGDVAAARRLFGGAHTLSRRDVRTQLWLIEDSVRRGDVAGALYQYDITLRVFPTMWEVLFPVLAAASSEPAIRASLVHTLAGSPSWGPFFVDFLSGHGPDPKAAALVLAELRRAGVRVADQAQASVTDRLLDAGAFDAAWNYYRSFRAGAERRFSRDAGFSLNSQGASRFDWKPIEGGVITATIANGLFDFAVPAGTGGPLLRQVQLLPAGTYRLSGHSIGIDQQGDAAAYWVLTCGDGRELGRVPVHNSRQASGIFSGTFVVPAACPVQTLTLVAQPSDAVGGLTGQIDKVRLVPVNNR